MMLFVIAVYIGFICSSYLPMSDFKTTVIGGVNNLTNLENLKIYPTNMPSKEHQNEVIKPEYEDKKPEVEGTKHQYESTKLQISQEQSYQQMRVLCWIMTGPNNYYTKVTIIL